MMKLNTSEKMLMALLRASMNEEAADATCFCQATEADWQACYKLARIQGVMALAWDAVATLPEELQMSCELKIIWGIAVEKYEKKYARYCRVIDELTALYAKEGIATIQLKGVGLSTYYPIPSHREGGDIDIYTCSADKDRMTDGQASLLADERMEQMGIPVNKHSFKHSNFFYKKIPIENHKVFLNVKQHPLIAQADALLKECLIPRMTTLLDGTCRIWIPSPAFNMTFVAFHSLLHYGRGMTLHHLCDWTALINNHGLEFPDELKDRRFVRAVAAMTCLCNRYLGTSVTLDNHSIGASLEVNEVELMADEMLEEMLRPKYPHKLQTPMKGKWKLLWFKTRRYLHAVIMGNHILYRPLWKRIWETVVALLRQPGLILKA